MIERLVIAAFLLLAVFAAYGGLRWWNLRRAANSAADDPILKDLKPGVPAIVYFTTPGCVPCRTQQQPALARLQAELGERVQIIRVDAADDTAAADRWGVFSAPTTFVLDRQGQPRQVNHGVADAARLRQQLEALA